MKITDLITTMNGVLDDPSARNYPVGRDSAEQYAQLCGAVSERLREYASLLRMGAFKEAKKANDRENPPITDRAKMLDFPRRGEWLALCRKNNWEEAVELDMDTVKALLSSENKQKAVSTEVLLEQWRVVAREGTLLEKLILARKIYAANPGSEAWRANLANMESAAIPKFLEEAHRLIEANQLEHLQDLYNELISPELLRPVHSEDLAPLQKALAKYQKIKLGEAKDAILIDIGMATANQDLTALENALKKWQQLKENPIFVSDDTEDMQVDEARSFLMERQAEEARQAMFEEKQNELEYMLNNKDDVKKIELVWHTVKSLDLPIRESLVARMDDLFATQAVERHRKHVRRTIGWIATAIAVTVAIVLVILFVQHKILVEDTCARMANHIATGHPESATELYRKLQKENPDLAEAPEIISVNKKALEVIEQNAIDRKKFEDLMTKIDSYLTEEMVEYDVVAGLFEDAEELSAKVDAEKAKLLTVRQERRDELLRTLKDRREAAFSKDMDALRKEMEKTYRECTEESDLNAVSGMADSYADRLKTLCENAKIGRVNVDFIKQRQGIEEKFLASLRSHITDMRNKCELKRQLYEPKTITEYLLALNNITAISPELAPKFTTAMLNRNTWQNLVKLKVSKGALTNPAQMKENIDAAKLAGSDPYSADLLNYTTRNADSPAERLRKVIGNLQQKVQGWNIREISFLTKDGQEYRFYLQDASDTYFFVEKDKLRRRLKSVTMDVKISDADTAKLILEYNTAEKKFIVAKESLTGALANIPAEFAACSLKMQKFADGDLPVATHYTFFSKKLNDLSLLLKPGAENLKSAMAFIREASTDIADEKNIPNAYARAVCLKYWFELLKAAVPGGEKQLGNLSNVFDQLLTSDDLWLKPTIAQENAEKIKQFNDNLANSVTQIDRVLDGAFDDNELLYQAVLRQPKPVGIVYVNTEKNTFRLYLFNKWDKNNDELTIRLPNADNQLVCYAFSPAKLPDGDIPLTELDQQLRKIYNGQLVFAPGGNVPYAEVLKKIDGEKQPEWPRSWPVNLRK